MFWSLDLPWYPMLAQCLLRGKLATMLCSEGFLFSDGRWNVPGASIPFESDDEGDYHVYQTLFIDHPKKMGVAVNPQLVVRMRIEKERFYGLIQIKDSEQTIVWWSEGANLTEPRGHYSKQEWRRPYPPIIDHATPFGSQAFYVLGGVSRPISLSLCSESLRS